VTRNINSIKLKTFDKSDEDDLYGEELETVIEAYNKTGKLYKSKQVDYFSKFYIKADSSEISKNTGNLTKGDEKANKSFRKLWAIADNTLDGVKKLKSNSTLKKTLKMMLNDNKMKPKSRVDAAKLASRLNDLPVTIQITSDNTNKKPINVDSYVIVPRVNRIFRPDYYVENYKAGNWNA